MNTLEENNFYATFSDIGKTKLKELFEQNDWQIRKSSWIDFELRNSWSELILEGSETELLLHGRVLFDKNKLILLDKLFNSLNGRYTYEFYDINKNCIFEKNR